MNATVGAEVQNGVLTVSVPLEDSPATLRYRTDRVAGYRPDDSVDVQLIGSDVPDSLLRIDLERGAPDDPVVETFPPEPDQTYTLSGTDHTGQVPVRIGYVYPGTFADEAERAAYEETLADEDGAELTVTYDDAAREITIWRAETATFAGDEWSLPGCAGWTLDVHHDYDPEAGTCYLGGGQTREVPARAARTNATGDRGVTALDDEVYHVPTEDGSTVFAFDADGRHRRTVDALADATRMTFEYDADRLVAIGDGGGAAVQVAYDDGVPTAFDAPTGTRTALDVAAGLVERISAACETVAFAYDDGGLLTSVTDPRGRTTRASYDETGRLTARLDPWGRTTSFLRTETDTGVETRLVTPGHREHTYQVEHDGDSGLRLYNECCGVGAETKVERDGTSTIDYPDGTRARTRRADDPRLAAARPVSEVTVETPSGRRMGTSIDRTVETGGEGGRRLVETITSTTDARTERLVYDVGQRITRTDPGGRDHTVALDDQGRPARVDVPGRATTRIEYTDDGSLAGLGVHGADDGLERGTALSYDDDGRLVAVADGTGRETRLAYDDRGRVTTARDAAGAVVSFDHDADGNLARVTPPGREPHAFEYGPGDRLTAYHPPAVDGEPAVTTLEYDADDYPRLVRTPDGETIDLEYDPAGRLHAVGTDRHDRRIAYDAETGALDRIEADGDVGLAFEYDGPFLTRQSWTGPVEGSVEYEYDATRLAAIRVGGAEVTYKHGDEGLASAGDLVVSRDGESGAVESTALGQIEDSRTRNALGDLDRYAATGDGLEYELGYTYDDAGRITAVAEVLDDADAQRQFEYDDAGRLSRAVVGGQGQYAYEYDENGNRTRIVGPDGARSAEYDARDRLVRHGDREYEHTASGYRSRETSPEGRTAYDYDVFGNLRRVELPDGRTIEYAVDVSNRRVAREVDGEVTRQFHYLDDLNPVAELDADGSVRSLFVYATRRNVPDYLVREGRRYRILTDHRGSPRLVVDADSGEVAQRIDYDPWGRTVRDTNPGFQPFGFAGGIYDPATGLVRFGARDYDPSVGRWTAPDPIWFAGGDANLYAYAHGDPVNFVDVTGQSARFIMAAVAGLTAAYDTAIADYGKRGRIDCTFIDQVSISYASRAIGSLVGSTSKRGLARLGKKGDTGPISVLVTHYVEQALIQGTLRPELDLSSVLVGLGTQRLAKGLMGELPAGVNEDVFRLMTGQVSRLLSLNRTLWWSQLSGPVTSTWSTWQERLTTWGYEHAIEPNTTFRT